MSHPEFSRPVKVEPLPRDGIDVEISAKPDERAALAKLNGLPAIERLEAQFHISKRGKGVQAEGRLTARVTQTCVVTLDPFEADIDAPVEVTFVEPNSRPRPAKRAEDLAAALDDADEPDPIVDGYVDLGAIAAEFLTLSLDPYPRKSGAEFAPADEPEREPSPFQSLAHLKPRDEPD